MPEEFQYVTCGSVIKLVHDVSRYRLHSHEINFSNGRQSVTAHGSRDDPNSYWLVKEGEGNAVCELGDKITCGSTIRLEHTTTRRNLHAERDASMLSDNMEVSAFGVAGEGDSKDSFILECEQASQCDAESHCENDAFWKRYDLVRLRHSTLSQYVGTSSRARYNDRNCPGCPILGQQEVALVPKTDDTLWFAAEGVYPSVH